MSATNDDRSVYWFYLIHGKEFGPVLISRLRQLAKHGELKPDDLVRKGTAGEWVYAGYAEELTTGTDLVVVPHPMETEAEAEDADDEQPVVATGPTLGERLSGLFANLRDGFVAQLGWLRTAVGVICLGATLVCLGRVLVNSLRLDWSPPLDAYGTIHLIWDELKTHREDRASNKTWKDFTSRSQELLAPIVTRLERDAKATHRESQLLLWASRDCLPKMFADARQVPSRSEEQLTEYLANVDLLREGQPIYGGNAGRTWLYETRSKPSWFRGLGRTTILVGVLTAANLALLIWVAQSLMKRREINTGS